MGTVKFRIEAILEDRKININEFSKLVGIAYPTAYDMAKGRSMQIRLETVAKICDTLEITPGELFEYTKV